MTDFTGNEIHVNDTAVAMYRYYDGLKEISTAYLCPVAVDEIRDFCVFTHALSDGAVWKKDQRLAFNPEDLVLCHLSNQNQ